MHISRTIQRVWLCSKSKLERIRPHLERVHGWPRGQTITFAVRIDPGLCCRFRRGIYHVYHDIPASHLELLDPSTCR